MARQQTNEKMSIYELKNHLRDGEYAWPGGYQKFFITNDGEALSYKAVLDNIYAVMRSTKNQTQDGWCVIGVDINWEETYLTCAHTGDTIPASLL